VPKRAAELTDRKVKAIKAPGMHAIGGVPGLYLQITAGAGRSWVYRYKLAGKRRDMGLGSTDLYSLAEARERARRASKQVAEGIDPIGAREAERAARAVDAAKAMTFSGAGEAYIQAHQAGWRNAAHAAQWPATLAAYVYPAIGDLPVAAIDTALVMKALEPIWTEKPETASRVRGRIESVLDWATARGHRTGENPARWRGHLENLLPKRSKVARVEHHAALPYAEIAAFMVELRQQEGVAARALEFAILTAARTGEVLKARWDEINIAERLWTVPAERMKSGREHRAPLSDAAMAIVEQMAAIRSGSFVFPGARSGDRPLSKTALSRTLSRMGRSDTVHGFRSTFADWCTEATNFPAEARELALAHAIGNRVEAAYRRGDLFEKRRQLAEAWARYCEAPAQGVVVPLRAAT
jgi:integrase